MKKKNDHKLLVAGLVIGAAAAGAAVYFFRDELAGLIDNFLGKEPETEPYADAQDREELLNHEILQTPVAENEHQG